MAVPFIDLERLTTRIRGDVLAAWAQVFDAREFVGGPRVGAVEKKLSAILGVDRTVSCANGTDALIIALQALGIGRGSKVALPNLTFWATYEAVANLGATPVLIDIDPDDLQIDVDAVMAAHLKHGLDAVLLVHLYGWTSSRLAELRAWSAAHKVPIVDDGAQCFGVEVSGKPVLSGAELATLSFYPAKVVGGAMDGGAITLSSSTHEALVRSLCNHGRATHYSYAHVGWNSRMGGVQAAFLDRMLDEVPAILDSRRRAAAFYRERLGKVAGVRVYGPPAGVVENGYLNVITLEPGEDVAPVVDRLKARGIGTSRTYPETLDEQKPASGAVVFGEMLHSRRVAHSVLSLPLFFGITDAELEESAAAFLACR